MESDLQLHPSTFHEQPPMNSGLTRYRSAPSSYFTNIIDREFYEHVFNRPSSPETERVFSRLINSFGEDSPTRNQNLSSLNLNPPVVKQEVIQNQNQNQQPQPQTQTQVMPSINNEPVLLQQQQQQNNMNMYESASSRNIYQSSAKPPLPNQAATSANRLPSMKTGLGSNSNLVRHSSSPAGLFANINIDSGYIAAMRGMRTFGGGNPASEEVNFPAATSQKNPPPAYSSGLMSSMAEIVDKNNRELDNPQNEGFGERQSSDHFMTGFPVDHWDDSAIMPDSISGLKRYRDDDDAKPFSGVNAAETKNESGNQGPGPLAHHLSLPKTAAEMAAIEKILQYSDSVPCKIRAKRGCATHPRSIAERVRRTKISERMRKLQDLVPNMDKQTNTADMLDLAVDYIKGLQKQVQTLSESQAKCTCSRGLRQ